MNVYYDLLFCEFCAVLCVGPFCHGARKVDLSTWFTTYFL